MLISHCMFKNKNVYLIIALLLFLVVVFLITLYVLKRNQEPAAIDSLFTADAPGTFVDTQGNDIAFEDFDNKVRIINAWATWSPFSTDELQALNAIGEEYKDREVVVLAVNRDEPAERIEAFLNTLPDLPNITFVRDTTDQLYGAFEGYAMPETLFYDADGSLIFHKRGVLTTDEMRTHIESALQSSSQ